MATVPAVRWVFWILLSSLASCWTSQSHGQFSVEPLISCPGYEPSALPGIPTGGKWNEGQDQTTDPISGEDLLKRIEQIEQQLGDQLASEKKKKEQDKKKPVIKPRGRLHSDANWFHQSGVNRLQLSDKDPKRYDSDFEDGVFARRARLGFDGSFIENTEVRLDYEMGAL